MNDDREWRRELVRLTQEKLRQRAFGMAVYLEGVARGKRREQEFREARRRALEPDQRPLQ